MVCVDQLWETECTCCHRPVRTTCRRRPLLVDCGLCCQTLEERLNWLHEVNVHRFLASAVRLGVLEAKEK